MIVGALLAWGRQARSSRARGRPSWLARRRCSASDPHRTGRRSSSSWTTPTPRRHSWGRGPRTSFGRPPPPSVRRRLRLRRHGHRLLRRAGRPCEAIPSTTRSPRLTLADIPDEPDPSGARARPLLPGADAVGRPSSARARTWPAGHPSHSRMLSVGPISRSVSTSARRRGRAISIAALAILARARPCSGSDTRRVGRSTDRRDRDRDRAGVRRRRGHPHGGRARPDGPTPGLDSRSRSPPQPWRASAASRSSSSCSASGIDEAPA